MPPSVLGKRSRPLSDTGSSGIVTRARRRIQILDENPDSDCTPSNDAPPQKKSKRTVYKKSKAAQQASVPAKHGPPGQRIPFSSTKSHVGSQIGIKDSDTIRVLQTPTPRTPRHRDALSKQLPLTPKHFVSLVGKPLTPESARQAVSPALTAPNVYQDARKALSRGTAPGVLVGRAAERAEISEFLSNRIRRQIGGCAYVSGPPGTGKSAIVTSICESLPKSESFRYAYMNCMSIKSTLDLYSKIAVDFEITDDTFAIEPVHLALNNAFAGKKSNAPLYVLTLDEVDQLMAIDLEILYNLFEWSLQPAARLVLVGIANALDFTERFLPRLKSRNLQPYLVPFLPYNASEIASVLSTRTRSILSSASAVQADFTPILHPTAIQLISKKVASQSGDLRKAFDIAKRVVDLVESETKLKLHQQASESDRLSSNPVRKPLEENPNLSSPMSVCQSPPKKSDTFGTLLRSLTPENAPRATLAHVVRVTSSTFGNGTSQRLRSLNLHQKAILCALCRLEQKLQQVQDKIMAVDACATPSKTLCIAPSVRAVFNAYANICKQDNILHALSLSEFRDVLGTLEALTLVSPADGKQSSFSSPTTPSRNRGRFGSAAIGDERRIASVVGIEELEVSLEGVGSDILRGILRAEFLE